MTTVAVRTKSPRESKTLTWDFSEELASGDSITGTPTATVVGGGTLTVSTPTVSGNVVSTRVSAGTANVNYVVRILALTVGGDTLEEEALIRVTEVATTYNPATLSETDKIRLLIADTDVSNCVFEDGELQALITLFGDTMLAAAGALRAMVVDKAKLSIYYSVNGFTMDRRELAKTLLAAAERIEKSALSAPFEFESVLEFFTDSVGQDRSNYMDTRP